jgi:hypothetical protein
MAWEMKLFSFHTSASEFMVNWLVFCFAFGSAPEVNLSHENG